MEGRGFCVNEDGIFFALNNRAVLMYDRFGKIKSLKGDKVEKAVINYYDANFSVRRAVAYHGGANR